MGYTHYWDNAPVTITPSALKAISKLLRQGFKEGVVAFEHDTPKVAPLVCDDAIRFNGVGDAGCETFSLEGGARGFCKTAHRPYDVYVVAVLHILAHYHETFKWDSDGDEEDLAEGKALAEGVME